ncbi:MAG TPA: PQQ-dependent sugar dehydrogenase [Herpetosiphonaceae bacterium]|nr:PQQ-dependent sugar dehydrogenase [Herpetosiphonaceae bacterium]
MASSLRSLTLALVVLFSLLGALVAAPVANAVTLPSGFSDKQIAEVRMPTALAFTPDGRLLITSQLGTVRVYKDGSLLSTPALNLSGKICTNRERGVLGIAVDPQFSSNRYIYLFYTYDKYGGCEILNDRAAVNRVSRFTMPSDQIDAGSEVVLLDNLLSPGGFHNAGDLNFGKDGNLYVSIGDGGCDYADTTRCFAQNNASRDEHVLLGKILRITPSGGIPSGNPFQGGDSARCNDTGRTDPGKRCQETYAWGLRNPFRFAFDPNASGTRFYINDVGQDTWEEIDLGQAGADYGWNQREGHCAVNSTSNCGTPAGMTNPIYDYGHGSGCESITGGAFVPDGVWPSAYSGAYLFSDYVCGKIFSLKRSSDGSFTRTVLASGLGSSSAVALRFGPYGSTQALYYTTYAGTNRGQIRRISYTAAANRTPTADVSASPTSGPAPLEVTFNGSGSSDPDGNSLTYLWNFGDGSAERETTSATTNYRYSAQGTYTASLRVRDSRGAISAAATVTINAGNSAPSPTIFLPSVGTRFSVGQAVTLQGSATDTQDGAIPNEQLSWTVTLHHGSHTHPFLSQTTGNNLTITAPAPEDFGAVTNSYLEIQLTATDSKGLSKSVTRRLDPRLVEVTFATNPSGLTMNVNGLGITAPRKLVTWASAPLHVTMASEQTRSGQQVQFVSWSDGSTDASRTITAPNAATTFVARFAGTAATSTPITNPSPTSTPAPLPTATDTAITDPTATNTAITGPTTTDTAITNPTATDTAITDPTATSTAITGPTATGTTITVPGATATGTPTTQVTAGPMSQSVYLPFVVGGTRTGP